MKQIATGIYAISGLKMGRSYLIDERDGLALIDTSSDGAAARIIAAIESLGRRPEDLRTIVATHYHHDHTGNVAALVERTGATFCVHADDVPFVDGRERWMPLKPPFGFMDGLGAKPYSLPVDRTLHDGDVIESTG